jgi:hypothetical protein
MAVIYVAAGVVMAVSSALIYLLPMVRNMEANLPDYAATPTEGADVIEAPVAAAVNG